MQSVVKFWYLKDPTGRKLYITGNRDQIILKQYFVISKLKPSKDKGLTGLPGGSDGKESACSAGDPGLITESGRFPGKGNGNPHHTLVWRVSWKKEPGRWQSMGLHSQTQLSSFYNNTGLNPQNVDA